MQAFWTNPDFYFILLSICGALSLLVNSLIVFRFLAITVSIGYLIVIFWVGLDKVGMIAQLGTSILGISLNALMITKYFYARSMASLEYTWRSVYVENFSLMLPFEFNKLMKHGQVKRIACDSRENDLVDFNQDFRSLYYLLDGSALVSVKGDRVATLYQGDWIAEESFLTGETSKDTVRVDSATLLEWTSHDLDLLKRKQPAIHEKLKLIISRNVCHKLMRAYQDEHRILHEKA